ncbi:hypothetical protein ABID25_006523 [Mesorhizobium abyssinicae]
MGSTSADVVGEWNATRGPLSNTGENPLRLHRSTREQRLSPRLWARCIMFPRLLKVAKYMPDELNRPIIAHLLTDGQASLSKLSRSCRRGARNGAEPFGSPDRDGSLLGFTVRVQKTHWQRVQRLDYMSRRMVAVKITCKNVWKFKILLLRKIGRVLRACTRFLKSEFRMAGRPLQTTSERAGNFYLKIPALWLTGRESRMFSELSKWAGV